jgi:membrane protein
MWFLVTIVFGWYLQHYADYSVIYGSLGAAIAILVWMYMISLVILIGAEFNAMLFPRSTLGNELGTGSSIAGQAVVRRTS